MVDDRRAEVSSREISTIFRLVVDFLKEVKYSSRKKKNKEKKKKKNQSKNGKEQKAKWKGKTSSLE